MIIVKINLKMTVKIEILKSGTLPHYWYFGVGRKILQLVRILPKKMLQKNLNKTSNRYDLSSDKEPGV